MTYVLTPEQMRAADAAAVDAVGEEALMRNAGMQIADVLRRIVPVGGRVVAFAGPGNNGGDAYAALAELGPEYDCVIHAAPSPKASAARLAAQARARAAEVALAPLPTSESAAHAALEGAIAVDGLFGTGARLPLAPEYRVLTRALDARRHRVLAIDIPSGVDAGSGSVSEDAVRATVTVTLGAAKPGLLLDLAREHVGELWCARIGIDESILAAQPRTFAALDDAELLALLPKRAVNTDKR
ncbi:MAG TPA: NAD(P)H-hydrate epimerase, partial [Candidatus Baltobacteraceae bacterium]|nr:NAD(P)H-hydrate epimerase [Candidatus Baltobacteraceae bacterium]